MLLVLTLVYIFHDFQTHAIPLTSLLAESAGTTVSACVCPSHRPIPGIIWSCLATIFASLWISVHPNIPLPNEAGWRVFLRRLELMFWALLGPELVIVWAYRQWLGACELEKLYKERGWTKTHGYFIQMGGFMLFEGNVAKGVLSPEKLSELLKLGTIEFPTVTLEEIEDRSKADGFSKTIAFGQALWFIVQCLARRAEHLDLTLLEQLTLSFTVLNGVMYFLWWHKPLDVRCQVRVYLLAKLPNDDAVETEHPANISGNVHRPLAIIIIRIHHSQGCGLIFWVILSPITLASLAFILLLWLATYLTTRLADLITSRQNIISTGDMRVPTFSSSMSKRADERGGVALALMSITGVVFGGIHCAGWLFISSFSGSANQAILWRVSSGALTGIAFLSHDIYHINHSIRFKMIERLSFGAVIILLILILVFGLSRLFLLVQAFISLRHLTPGMLVSSSLK